MLDLVFHQVHITSNYQEHFVSQEQIVLNLSGFMISLHAQSLCSIYYEQLM